MAKKPTFNFDLAKRLVTRFKRMRHREHFDMETVGSPTKCGAAFCIAGHALDLEGYRHKKSDYHDEYDWYTPQGRKVADPLKRAQKLLGLSYSESQHQEFGQNNYHGSNGLFFRFDLKTPKQAAKLIQKLIDEKELEVRSGTTNNN